MRVLSDLLPVDIPSYAVVVGDTTNITGRQGELCYSTTLNTVLVGDGTRWVPTERNGFKLTIVGKTLANEKFVTASDYPWTMSQGRSYARAGTAATAQTIFTIKSNGLTIGTITFGIGQTTGVLSITGPAIATGDFLAIEAPATPDATLADIVIALRP